MLGEHQDLGPDRASTGDDLIERAATVVRQRRVDVDQSPHVAQSARPGQLDRPPLAGQPLDRFACRSQPLGPQPLSERGRADFGSFEESRRYQQQTDQRSRTNGLMPAHDTRRASRQATKEKKGRG